MNIRDSRSLTGRVHRLGWWWLWWVARNCLHLWLSDSAVNKREPALPRS